MTLGTLALRAACTSMTTATLLNDTIVVSDPSAEVLRTTLLPVDLQRFTGE